MREPWKDLVGFFIFLGLNILIFFIRTLAITPYQILITNVLFTMATIMSILIFVTFLNNLFKRDLEMKYWEKWKIKNAKDLVNDPLPEGFGERKQDI
ncbi:MAG: hypothetical protein ACFE9S_01790 [Candidatus Hermodarchaeota archaeon]